LLRSLKHSSHSKNYYKFHTEKEKNKLYSSKKYTLNEQRKLGAEF